MLCYAEYISLPESQPSLNPAKFTSYYVDQSSNLTFSEILTKDEESWQAISDNIPSFGYDVQSSYWLKLEVENSNSRQQSLLLAIEYPILDYIQVYFTQNNVITNQYSTGDLTDFDSRPIDNANFLFPFQLETSEKIIIYIRVRTESSVQIPLSIWDREHYFIHQQLYLMGQGLYFGILIVMVLYNIFIYLAVRQTHYIYYVFAVLSMFVLMASILGFGFQYIWTAFPNVNRFALTTSLSLFGVTATAFSISILNLKKYSITFYNLLRLSVLIYALTAVGALFMPYKTTIVLLVPFGILTSSISLAAGIFVHLQGYRPARYYVLGYSSVLVGAILISSNKLGWIEANFLTENSMQIGSMLEVILLSFALADRINVEKKGKIKAQQDLTTVRLKMYKEQFAQKELALMQEAATKAKDEFLSTMSHEIRTPMNGVIGILQLLKSTHLDAQQKDLLRIMEGSSESLLSIINDILDFSKIQAGKMNIENIPFDLQKLIADIDKLYSMTTKLNDVVNFKVNLDAKVPQAVLGDPTRIRQILTNFLNNAVKFTREGEVSLSVTVIEADQIKFIVKDSGIGISQEGISSLFGKFSQTSADISRKYGGTGLGLNICKNLSELMGGQVGVESEEGVGSSFWFSVTLPESEEVIEDNNLLEEHDNALNDLNLLVAEDNTVNRLIVKKMLNKININQIEFAENGKEVISLFTSRRTNNEKCDLILMDCLMPVIDGYEATKQIREYESKNELPAIPIIALTANAGEEAAKQCIAAGMNSHLAKPIILEKLQASIYQEIKKSSKLRPLIRFSGDS